MNKRKREDENEWIKKRVEKEVKQRQSMNKGRGRKEIVKEKRKLERQGRKE